MKTLGSLEKKVLIASVILILVIVIAFIALINKSKSEEVLTGEIVHIDDLVINEEDMEELLVAEYADINEISENVIEENKEEEDKNTQKNNTITNTITTNNKTGGAPYYIKVNYGAQVVTIYKKDADGNYTVPIKAMVCSTGVATPKSGVYKIQYRWKWLGLQGDVYGQYATQIVGNILFHSVPYLERGNPASLEYWEYDKLGSYASAGCIRLKVSDAIWIYNNCAKGTMVEFYSSSNPGPLGKPSAQKISNAKGELKNWDPTDPDARNPWKTYKPEEDKKEDTNTQANTNTDKNNTNIDKNNNTNTQIDTTQKDNDKTNIEVNENLENNKQDNDKVQNEEQNKIENETKEEILDNKEEINEII